MTDSLGAAFHENVLRSAENIGSGIAGLGIVAVDSDGNKGVGGSKTHAAHTALVARSLRLLGLLVDSLAPSMLVAMERRRLFGIPWAMRLAEPVSRTT